MFVLPENETFFIDTVVIIEPITGKRELKNVNRTYTNVPVNMCKVHTYKKDTYGLRGVPDFKLYTIVFTFSRNQVEWYYMDEKMRDADFKVLLPCLDPVGYTRKPYCLELNKS